MSHHVTIYGALWATSKENNVINLVNGTVSQNTLPGVLRISCVAEPYHQTKSFLRSDSVHSSSKSLNHFPCRSDFSTIKVKSMQRPGTEAIRIQIQPSKPKRIITKITNSQNTTRIYGQPSEQLFPKRGPLSNPNRTKNNMNTRNR